MNVVLDNFDLVLKAFWYTIQLLVFSGLASLLGGALLAGLRVGPVSVMRSFAATYVTLVRNTPLLIIFIFVFGGAPAIGLLVGAPFLLKGVIALSIYTSAFVCEALRSGINAVDVGQAEAARAIGMTFGQTMSNVILPQSIRASVPPMASVLIALAKNTSVGAAFGLLEATARMRFFANRNASDTIEIFLVFALGYILIVAVLSTIASQLERRWRVA